VAEPRDMESRDGRRKDDRDPARFLKELRQLRSHAGLGHAELAARAHYPCELIRAAEDGPSLPDLPVLSAYVRACGGAFAEWEERWRSITGSPASPLLSARPPGCSEAADAGARIGATSVAADSHDPSLVMAALGRVADGMAAATPVGVSSAASSSPVPSAAPEPLVPLAPLVPLGPPAPPVPSVPLPAVSLPAVSQPPVSQPPVSQPPVSQPPVSLPPVPSVFSPSTPAPAGGADAAHSVFSDAAVSAATAAAWSEQNSGVVDLAAPASPALGYPAFDSPAPGWAQRNTRTAGPTPEAAPNVPDATFAPISQDAAQTARQVRGGSRTRRSGLPRAALVAALGLLLILAAVLIFA
jgi:hypothetical protein